MANLGSCNIIAMIPTKDKQRAREFYESVLGLRFVNDDSFALVFDAHGIQLRITKVPEFTVTPYTILGWEVPDIVQSVTALRNAGVEFNKYDWPGQDHLRIWTAPDGSRIAWFKDPDGNTLSVTQHAVKQH
jgi:catechol 2,3-dioxygenase-like lactoylglutathione lyase family enzyme